MISSPSHKAYTLVNMEFLSLKHDPIKGVKLMLKQPKTDIPAWKVEFDVPVNDTSDEDWKTVSEESCGSTGEDRRPRCCHAGHKIPMTITFPATYPLAQPSIKFGQLRDYLDYGHCCFEKYLSLDWQQFVFINPQQQLMRVLLNEMLD